MRKDWVDIVKGIGISLVVIAHTRFQGGFIGEWINTFHMPLFFIIAGFCFDELRYANYKSYVMRKVQVLAFPYFTLSLFVISMMCLFYLGDDPQFSTINLLKNMCSGGTIGAFWFICVLFQVELFFALIVKLFSQKRDQLLVLCCCFSISIGLQGKHLPYFLDITFLSLPFYGLGYFVKRLEAMRAFDNATICSLITLGCLVLNGCLFVILEPGQTIYVGNQYSNPFVFVTLASLGTFLIIFISRTFDLMMTSRLSMLKKPVVFLGKNSIIILATHNALGLCRHSWPINGVFSVLIELGVLVTLLYVFSSPMKAFMSLNKLTQWKNV